MPLTWGWACTSSLALSAVSPKKPLALALTTKAPEDMSHWRREGPESPEAFVFCSWESINGVVFFMPRLLWPIGPFVLF